MMPLPDALVARSYLMRGVVAWFGARALLSLWLATTCRGCNLMELLFSAGTTFIAIVLAVTLALIETHRLREWALLGNLGVATWVIAMLYAIPAMVGEAAIRLARALAT